MVKRCHTFFFVALISLGLVACDDQDPWNNPYPKNADNVKVLYTSFPSAVVTLDPAKTYVETGLQVLHQVDEPPLQYHYLKRPFQLQPLVLTEVPIPHYFDQWHQPLPQNARHEEIAYTRYNLEIKPGVLYAPHPAFAKDKAGHYRYHHLRMRDLQGVSHLSDFSYSGTRELHAADFAYAIKRLASPQVNSPIFGVMAEYIFGLNDLRQSLKKVKSEQGYLDLRRMPLPGVKVLDDHHLQITLKGEYPQFLAWLTMGFFSPIPWEADLFYSQSGMRERNLTFDWYPLGTGAYQLQENNPNRRMVLVRNPNFRLERFPADGSAEDKEKGFLQLAGKRLPMIDKLYMSLEKESIPRWGKFLQGYYDASLVSGQNFDQAIYLDALGRAQLSEAMKQQDVRLEISVQPVVYFLAFNWLDPTVGGGGESQRKLRQALAIALDFDEYVQIFLNGQGRQGRALIPPGIFGFRPTADGINPGIYRFQDGKMVRRSLAEAKRLLAEAGYPNGINPKTGTPLRLHFDVAVTGPTATAYFGWLNKQFQQLGIDVQVHNTQFNRYQEKIRQGDCQIFMSNWMGDYPDPENFLFLLYGPNGKKEHGGVNVANYKNDEYDRLFVQMKTTPNGLERQATIDKMRNIVYRDMPIVASYYPIHFKLVQAWSVPSKPISLTGGYVKYFDLDSQKRLQSQKRWNQPNTTLIWVFVSLIVLGVLIGVVIVRWQGRISLISRFDLNDEDDA